MGVIVETPRLRLRRITAGDADLMLAIWNDPAFIRYVGDRDVHGIEQARTAVEADIIPLYARYGYGPFCIIRKADATRIGICGLFRREQLDHPDIGFAVLPEFAGAGFALEAATAVIGHARAKLAISTLYAICSPRNQASIGLIEKLGFTSAGGITMRGEREEVCLYGMTLA